MTCSDGKSEKMVMDKLSPDNKNETTILTKPVTSSEKDITIELITGNEDEKQIEFTSTHSHKEGIVIYI